MAVRSSSTRETISIPALDCPEEMALIERGLRRLEGLGELEPDYLRRTLRVEFDPARLDAATLVARVREIGFPAEVASQTSAELPLVTKQPRRTSLWIGGALLLAAVAWRLAAGESDGVVATLAIASTIVSGARVAQAGWRAVRLLALDMNALMTIAATGAILTGDYFEAATAMLLFGVALWLERASLDRARRAVGTLAGLAPAVAHRLEPGPADDVDPRSVQPGDLLLVKPGERLPADGRIESGETTINQAPITGESKPVARRTGDDVFAGTLNGDGSLKVRATRRADESVLAEIGRLVEQAQAARSPTERFVDQFARRYTPAVIVLAVLVALGPALLEWVGVWPDALGSVRLIDWIHRGLVLLVIACPCALVISTPVTIVCGLNAAARRGVLIKGGVHLESAGRVDSIALDKTGTLTMGRPEVIRVVAQPGHREEEVLRVAAALEAHSAHPLAAGIVAEANRRAIPLAEPADFAAEQGRGVTGKLDGQQFFVGSRRYLVEHGGVDEETLSRALAEANGGDDGLAAVLVGASAALWGIVLMRDAPRRDAKAAIDKLRRLKIHPITMLTGDHAEVAARVARELGIDEVRAGLLPDEKLAAVRELAAARPHLAMVGDGVNDAPALAASHLGIAMGAEASATALETADVIVMTPHLGRVAELFSLGRRCRTLLAQNITFAIAIKLLVLVLAAVGVATMWMAVAADVGASLIVIFNGMRLLNHSTSE
ncbi:MAG: cation-translocating P-type ATPase [Pirellulales bacterium]|nr:cation-translocating P-type ATPase [Pirellulales bacterium]